MEVQWERHQRATVLGRLSKCVCSGPRTLLNCRGPLVRRSRQPQVVPELDRLADSHRDDGGNEVDLPQPAPRHPCAEEEPAGGGLKWQQPKPATALSSEPQPTPCSSFWSVWATWFAVPCTQPWECLPCE